MITRTVTPEDLARLKAEREEADRLYNEALTALDAAIQQVPDLPHPPPGPDETQITPLNERWSLGLAGPQAGGWRGRLAGLVWRLVAPYFERQQTFNAAVVDHFNRNLAVQRETQQAIEATIDTLGNRIRDLVAFESRLIMYLQQITPYIDTKDFEFAGISRRLHEDARHLIDLADDRANVLDHRTIGLSAAISGVGDELAKRWESMVAREQRYEARVASLGAAHDELRGTLAILQQATSSVKREVERLGAAGSPVLTRTEASSTGEVVAPDAVPAFEQARATTVDAYKYVGFEDRFRGSQDDIRGRLEGYLPYFDGASDVLDVGCGRGEFLDLLSARGISCRGVDLNQEMVEVCRARGLQVDQGDALGFLRSLPDGSLGGLLAAQVVEHLQPDYLLGLLDAAYQKLRPGSRMILETINPACWFAFFASYIRDITHVRPLHADTLSYFVQASGFQRVTIRYSVPYPEHEKLQRVTSDDEVGRTINANVEKLNGLMFTHLDYAVIGERL